MIVLRTITLPVRVTAGAARLGWRTGRLVGTGRAVTFSAGVAVGVVIASPTARRAVLAGVSSIAGKVAERRRPTPPPAAPVAGPAAIDISD